MNGSLDFYGGTGTHRTDSRKPECYMGESTWGVVVVATWCTAALHRHSRRNCRHARLLLCVIRTMAPKFVVCTLEYANEGRAAFVRRYFAAFLAAMTVPVVCIFLVKLGLDWSALLLRLTFRSACTVAAVALQVGLYFSANCLCLYSVFKLVVYVPTHENRFHWLVHERLWSGEISVALVLLCLLLQILPCLFDFEAPQRRDDVIARHATTTWQLLGANTTCYVIFVNVFYHEKLVSSGYVAYDAANMLTCVSALLTFGLGSFPDIMTFGWFSERRRENRKPSTFDETVV